MNKQTFVDIVKNVNEITDKITAVEDILDCYFETFYEPVNNIFYAIEKDMCKGNRNKEFTDRTFEILHNVSDEDMLSDLYDKIERGDKEYVIM